MNTENQKTEFNIHEFNNYNVRIPGTPPTYEELTEESSPKFHNRKARLKDHIVNLKEQWIGYPHALYYMSVKIACIRRHMGNQNPDLKGINHPEIHDDIKHFYWLLSNCGNIIIENIYHEHLKLRWVNSLLDTIIDTHDNPMIRMQALNLVCLTKCIPQWLNAPGMQTFFTNDTFHNLFIRIKKNLNDSWDGNYDPTYIMLHLLDIIEKHIINEAEYEILIVDDNQWFTPLSLYPRSGPLDS